MQNQLELKQATTSLMALVLCGGESKRMGSPKCTLVYHQVPQFIWVQDLLKPFVEDVYLSCKTNQEAWFRPTDHLIFDENKFADAGPMQGLLSAVSLFPTKGILVLGCDYPYLIALDIQLLCEAYTIHQKTCCYVLNDRTEPLLAIYHPNDLQSLLEFYAQGNRSLNHFLVQIDCIKITSQAPERLMSIDQ